MKNLIFTITFIIMFVFQSVYSQRLHVGMQSGVVFSKAGMTSYDKTYASNIQFITTNATNLYVNYEIKPKISLSMEPGYIQKSTDLNGGLTYIQLPLVVEYNMVDKLRLTAGPELNFLLNNDTQKKYKILDTAVQIGAYYGTASTIDVGIKYSRSIGGFLKIPASVATEKTSNFYHYYFQLFTRYKF